MLITHFEYWTLKLDCLWTHSLHHRKKCFFLDVKKGPIQGSIYLKLVLGFLVLGLLSKLALMSNKTSMIFDTNVHRILILALMSNKTGMIFDTNVHTVLILALMSNKTGMIFDTNVHTVLILALMSNKTGMIFDTNVHTVLILVSMAGVNQQSPVHQFRMRPFKLFWG